jgi:ABC-type transport system involved in multi-copper enzyme maturation permease subunit
LTGPRRELSDLLSPILVKELRQGVRSHVFTGSFLLQQVLIALVAALAVLGDAAASDTAPFFWMLVVVPLLIVLPLSAGAAISGEKALGTLEPMLLTPLSARRIAVGKWASSAAQSALLVAAILPFLFLRYFMGRVDLTMELVFLLALLLCSGLLSALTVALSPSALSPLFRWILSGFVGLALSISFLGVFGEMRLGLAGSFGVAPYLAFGAIGLALLLAALEAAALQIAPRALSRPLGLRLLTLAVLATLAGVGPEPEGVQAVALGWGMVVALSAVVYSLCEPPAPIPSLYVPYRSGLRRLLGLVFAPGWPGGVGFTLLVIAGAVAFVPWSPGATGSAVAAFGLLGSLLLPVALGGAFRRGHTFPRYLVTQCLSFLLAALWHVGQWLGAEGVEAVGGFFLGLCPGAYALAWHQEPAARPGLLTVPGFVFMATVGVVVSATLVRTWAAWRRIDSLAPPGPATP